MPRSPGPAPRARWRLPLPPLGLTARVFVGTAAIVTAVLASVLAIASVSARRAADAAARRGLEQATDLAAQFLAGRARSLSGGARVFVQGPYFRAIVAERRQDDIYDQALEAAGQLDADWVFITDDRGVLLAKSDEPEAVGEPLGDVPLVAGALAGRVTSGFGVSRDSLLFQTVAVPIVVPGGAPVGVLVAAKVVDTTLAKDVRSATAAEIAFYTLDQRGRPWLAATTLGTRRELAGRVAELLRRPDDAAPQAAQPHTRVTVADSAFDVHGAAVTTSGGDVVGGFLVLRPHDPDPAGTAGVRRSLLAAGLLGLALALAAAYGAAVRVTGPVRALAEAARRAADGDYGPDAALAPAAAGRRDEIGALADAFAAMLADLRGKRALVALLGEAAGREAGGRDAPPAAAIDSPGRAPLAVVRAAPGGAGGRAARAAGRAGAQPAPDTQSAPEAHPGPGPAPGPAPGNVFADRYAVERAVGSGGMGVVYKATDLRLGETVALKVLRPDVLAADPRALERFTNELRLTRRISHRNVVRTHDLGEHGGVTFITMEYVEGSSLAAMLRARGPLPPAAVLSIATQLCRALEVAHEQGVVHGDLKPQNLLVGADGVLKVTDFGVARVVRRSGGAAAGAPSDIAGAVVGTPEYMAPEQLLGRDAGVRGDIYAAGVVLHECVTGVTPFGADTPLAFIARKLDDPAALPRGAAAWALDRGVPIPDALADVIRRMTAPNPDDRPASAAELYELFARVA